jgi:uncharacterized RDD family membrane protein YckC
VTHPYLVLTPEKVVVTYQLGGVPSRILANLIDIVAAAGCGMGASWLATLSFSAFGIEAALGVSSLAFLVTFVAYFVLFEGLGRGRTLGKIALRLRVLMVDGTPVTFAAALYRNLLRPGDFLPLFYVVGLVAVFTNARAQRLGDIAAGTVVVREPDPDPNFTPAPHRVGVHRHEDSVGNLSRMTIEEYTALKRLADRFPFLPPETQLASLQEIWAPLAGREGIQPLPGVHPIYQIEAAVMKFGRLHNLV